MKIHIRIIKDKLYSKLEGLSTRIGELNGNAASWESIWASEDDNLKLDLWTSDSINEIETELRKWYSASDGFELGDWSEYELVLEVSDLWKEYLNPLLQNRIEDFFLHSVIVGWLAGLEGVNSADYGSMAIGDLEGVKELLLEHTYNAQESSRTEDDSEKQENAQSVVGRDGKDDSEKQENAQSVVGRDGKDDDKSSGGGADQGGESRDGKDTGKKDSQECHCRDYRHTYYDEMGDNNPAIYIKRREERLDLSGTLLGEMMEKRNKHEHRHEREHYHYH